MADLATEPSSHFPNGVFKEGSLNCELQGNLKAFARAILALSKLGEQLFLEPSSHGLAVRALNSTRSAYACFFFSTTFFTHFHARDPPEHGDNRAFYKISMKNALAIFKYASNMEKTVLSCRMQVDSSSDFLYVRVSLRHDVMKYYEVPLIDATHACSPIFDKNVLLNLVVSPAKMIMQILNQLKVNSDDLSLSCNEEELVIRNYHPSDPDRSRHVLKTEARILNNEFDRFAVQMPSEIICSLREFAAVISFADLLMLPVSLYFDKPGRPLIVALESNIDFSADFVIGTLDTDMRASVAAAIAPSLASTSSITPRHHLNREIVGDENATVDPDENAIAHPDENDPDVLPASPSPPASKRFRCFFLGASQCTMRSSQYLRDQSVLANDSDEEIMR